MRHLRFAIYLFIPGTVEWLSLPTKQSNKITNKAFKKDAWPEDKSSTANSLCKLTNECECKFVIVKKLQSHRTPCGVAYRGFQKTFLAPTFQILRRTLSVLSHYLSAKRSSHSRWLGLSNFYFNKNKESEWVTYTWIDRERTPQFPELDSARQAMEGIKHGLFSHFPSVFFKIFFLLL